MIILAYGDFKIIAEGNELHLQLHNLQTGWTHTLHIDNATSHRMIDKFLHEVIEKGNEEKKEDGK